MVNLVFSIRKFGFFFYNTKLKYQLYQIEILNSPVGRIDISIRLPVCDSLTGLYR